MDPVAGPHRPPPAPAPVRPRVQPRPAKVSRADRAKAGPAARRLVDHQPSGPRPPIGHRAWTSCPRARRPGQEPEGALGPRPAGIGSGSSQQHQTVPPQQPSTRQHRRGGSSLRQRLTLLPRQPSRPQGRQGQAKLTTRKGSAGTPHPFAEGRRAPPPAPQGRRIVMGALSTRRRCAPGDERPGAKVQAGGQVHHPVRPAGVPGWPPPAPVPGGSGAATANYEPPRPQMADHAALPRGPALDTSSGGGMDQGVFPGGDPAGGPAVLGRARPRPRGVDQAGIGGGQAQGAHLAEEGLHHVVPGAA